MRYRRKGEFIAAAGAALIGLVPLLAILPQGRQLPAQISLALIVLLVVTNWAGIGAMECAAIAFTVCAVPSASVTLELAVPWSADRNIGVSPAVMAIAIGLVALVTASRSLPPLTEFQRKTYSSLLVAVSLAIFAFTIGRFVFGQWYPLDSEMAHRVYRHSLLAAASPVVVYAAWSGALHRRVLCTCLGIGLAALAWKGF